MADLDIVEVGKQAQKLIGIIASVAITFGIAAYVVDAIAKSSGSASSALNQAEQMFTSISQPLNGAVGLMAVALIVVAAVFILKAINKLGGE